MLLLFVGCLLLVVLLVVVSMLIFIHWHCSLCLYSKLTELCDLVLGNIGKESLPLNISDIISFQVL